jgi:gliding motility-associated-like protein
LTYIDKPVFYIPNTFTPDEDQFNQTWGPVFTSGFDPFNFDLFIYNRWGELIWESHDAKERWDGSFGKKGLKVPSGIYSYKIRFKPTTTDEKVTVSGHINLMR